jgi:hypothetical protein
LLAPFNQEGFVHNQMPTSRREKAIVVPPPRDEKLPGVRLLKRALETLASRFSARSACGGLLRAPGRNVFDVFSEKNYRFSGSCDTQPVGKVTIRTFSPQLH